MAVTNYISTKGQREDLADIIAVVDARETVLTSTLKKGKKPANALVEFLIDTYPSASSSGTVDGTDVTFGASGTTENFASGRVRYSNYIQTFRRAPAVTRLEETVAVIAGVDNPDPNGVAGSTEFNRAKAKAIVQVKRDVEYTLLSDNSAVADNGTAAYKTRGLGKWLTTTAESVPVATPTAAQLNANSVWDSGLTATQTLANFNEDALRGLLQQRWTETGKTADLIGVVGPDIKNAVSDFTRYLPNVSSTKASVRYYNQAVADKKINTSVDIYSGDYGTIELFLSAWVPNTYRGYILDPDYAELRTHTSPYFQQLPDLGGGPRGIVETILALVVTGPKAHCKIAC